MNKSLLQRRSGPFPWERFLRITAGMILSVLAAKLLGIEFAASTAIVTLLGIQSTRRETFSAALKRAVSFAATVGIAFLFHLALGTGLPAFFLTLAVLTALTEFIGWEATLSINIVVAVHLFLKNEPFTAALILNELLRVAVGVAVALGVNASLPDRESELKSCRAGIEEAFRSLLEAAARLVQGSGDAAQARALADSLRSALADGRRYAAAYADNNLASHSDYFLRYIMMREAEFSVLEELLGQAEKAGGAQGCEAACAYLRGCAQRVSAESDLTEDRRLLTQLRDTLGQLPMPAGRAEFLRQAALFACADSLHEMVSIKESFVDSLSDEQRRRYWAAAE